jgi:hypothetical protein
MVSGTDKRQNGHFVHVESTIIPNKEWAMVSGTDKRQIARFVRMEKTKYLVKR